MFAAIMQITIYLTMVLTPVLIPGALHVFHVARNRRQANLQNQAVHAPRVAAPRRLAVPAAVPAAA
jgi:hypothetical protein